MSLSGSLVKIGTSIAALCAIVALFGLASGTPTADGGTGSTPPTTTAASPNDGNPWHG